MAAMKPTGVQKLKGRRLVPNCAAVWFPLPNFQSLLVGRRLGGASDVVKGFACLSFARKCCPKEKPSPFSIGRALNSATTVTFTAFAQQETANFSLT